jgi:hypothetical protein
MTHNPNMLCDVCKTTITDMWRHRWPVGEAEPSHHVYPHHDSYESLCNSQKICHICYRLHQRIEHMGIIASQGDEGSKIVSMGVPLTNARWRYFLSASQNRITFNLMLHIRDKHNVVRLGPCFLLDFSLHPLSNARLSDGLSNSTDVSKCANVVRKWVKSCDELHPECLLGRKTDWFPTRLLDLRNVETSGYINLVLPDSSWADKPYATLSHCWGGSTPLKLTTATFASFRAGLAVEQLPKTFIEAIKVAIFLGIYYIWIDALTIIQDSSDDWKKKHHSWEMYISML